MSFLDAIHIHYVSKYENNICLYTWHPLNFSQFSLITFRQKVISNILFEAFMPNLVSLTHSSLQILGKLRQRYFRFPDIWSIP